MEKAIGAGQHGRRSYKGIAHRATAGTDSRVIRSFYFLMSLLIAALVAYAFSQTIEQNLIHPSVPRPSVLYAHAVIFFGWVALFMAQTALIQVRNIRLHRRLGLAGLAIGTAIPIVGIATALTMARFNVGTGSNPHDDAAAFLVVPFNDMIFFSITFGLAVWWRRKPEFHRRLMFLATCLLTAAAFARFPFITMDEFRFYAGVDLLILLGVGRDLFATRQVHVVYRSMLPILVIAQVVTMATFLHHPPIWMNIAGRLIG
jgi:hypothetical protein